MEKYLRLYAEPECAALSGLNENAAVQTTWQNVMVIPACNESGDFLRPPPACAGRSLMILVINESVAASEAVSSRNQALAAEVRSRFTAVWHSTSEHGLSLLQDPLADRDVLLVDRFSQGLQLPVKGGVGHARKIGVDLATSLTATKRIFGNWIHCTDADVLLPQDYFESSRAVDNTGLEFSTLIYPFHHCDVLEKAESPDVVLATRLYELSLRYYVAGMKYARSPYAFHTIGSTMAISAFHYAKVRGFPRRAAGEDFYLLSKLAKVGKVLDLAMNPDCMPIEIEARRSDRVPFGTGAAVNRITTLDDQVADFSFYHPALFELLRVWLQCLPLLWQAQSTSFDAVILAQLPGEDDQKHATQALLAGLKTIKTEQALEHAFKQSKDLDQFTRQMHTWFDAFRTLKLIHAIRDLQYPNISYAMLDANPIYSRLLSVDAELSVFHKPLRHVLSR